MFTNIIKYSLFVLLTIFILFGCDESITDEPLANQPPETSLFLYPDGDISKQKSRLRVHWWGDDKDGIVTGFIFRWEGIDDSWSFTTSNDSVFALPIGTVDTSFVFYVASIDNSGNMKYDDKVFLNGLEIMSEPFIDENNNGQYDEGERFFDFGAIDESPASQAFPIKNSAPEIQWNDISVLPEISFPVITVGWDASDLDGNETINEIRIAINDTSTYLSLPGSTRLVSLIVDDLQNPEPNMNVFINADNNKKFEEDLSNLRLNDYNRLFIKAVDNSGASSHFIPLPDTSKNWFIKKPNGNLLIVDDFFGGSEAETFYTENFNKFAQGNFDIFDIEMTELPYETISFQNTLNLFDFVFWYSGSNPRIDLTNLVTQSFLQNGGNLFYSMTFRDSSANFDFSTQIVQSFLPIIEFDDPDPLPFLFAGANIIPTENYSDYPTLETQTTVGFVRTFKVSEITASPVFDMTSAQLNGTISLMNNTKNLFFIGLPLHQCDARGNVAELLEKVFVNEFGLDL